MALRKKMKIIPTFEEFASSTNEASFATNKDPFGGKGDGWKEADRPTVHVVAIAMKKALDKGDIDQSQYESALDVLNMAPVPDDAKYLHVIGGPANYTGSRSGVFSD